MPKPRLVKLAESWRPDPKDPHGEDKLRLIRYLLQLETSAAAPIPILKLLREVPFTTISGREPLQHKLLGPLRRDRRVFIGTSNRGVFLVTSAEDVDATLGFYTWRVRAELRHARNLKALAKRTKVLDGYTPKAHTKDRAVIYFDESGTPNIADKHPPVFVVAAVIIDSRQDLSMIDHRFNSATTLLKKPAGSELRTKGMSIAHHAKALRELAMLDFQWAAACFDKSQLDSVGFQFPKTFYRYAFQFLVGELLTLAWQADLVIDENSTTTFQSELREHLRRQNSGLPVNRLGEINFAQSSKTRLVQLADLIAGAVRRRIVGEPQPFREIEHKMIDLHFWPPRG
ncbi:MAG: DUF3800 domain-containing protein [Vicinamibacterales bacterium]